MHMEIRDGSLLFNDLGEYYKFNDHEFLHIASSVKYYKVNRPNGVITSPPNSNLVTSFMISVVKKQNPVVIIFMTHSSA